MAPKKRVIGPHTGISAQIPTSVWERCRIKSVQLGISMNVVIRRLLRAWADDEIELPAESEGDDADGEVR